MEIASASLDVGRSVNPPYAIYLAAAMARPYPTIMHFVGYDANHLSHAALPATLERVSLPSTRFRPAFGCDTSCKGGTRR